MNLYAFILILMHLSFHQSIAYGNNNCVKYKSLWFSRKYPYNHDLMKYVSMKLNDDTCLNAKCCDGAMQKEIISVSRIKLQTITTKYMTELSDQFSNYTNLLTNFIQSNVDKTRLDLDKMFMNTYNRNYATQKQFFSDFFTKIKSYMLGNSANDLKTIASDFFNEMASRIFQMMEQKPTNPLTIRCLTRYLLQKNPYQGTEKAIIDNLVESYPNLRVFLNTIRAVHDLVQDFIKKQNEVSWDCSKEYARLFQCGLCSMSEMKPCSSSCSLLAGKCLGSLNTKEIKKIHKAWIKLFDAQSKLARRMDNRFSFPQVNMDLHLKISNAIMTVHNFVPGVRNEIHSKCRSIVHRSKKSLDVWPQNPYQSNSVNQLGQTPVYSSNRNISLSNLLIDFMKQLPQMKSHFKQFKKQLCHGDDVKLSGRNENCWNGTDNIYTKSSIDMTSDRSKKQKTKGELSPNSILFINKINKITVLINNLLSGVDRDPKSIDIEYKTNTQAIEQPFVAKNMIENQAQPPLNQFSMFNRPSVVPTNPYNQYPSAYNTPIDGSGQVPPNESTNRNPIIEKPTIDNQFPNIPNRNQFSNNNNNNQFPNIPNNNNNNPFVNPVPSRTNVDVDDEDLNRFNNIPQNKPTIKYNEKIVEGSGSQIPTVKGPSTFAPPQNPGGWVPPQQSSSSSRDAVVTINPIQIEGSGSGEENEGYPENTNVQTFAVFPIISTTKAPIIKEDQSSMTNNLPGNVPHDIWIPQVLDTNQYPRSASVKLLPFSAMLWKLGAAWIIYYFRVISLLPFY